MLALILLIALSSYFSFLYINNAEENIRKSTQIERLVLQMDIGQQKARKLIGSFFLQCQHSSLREAHERYAQPSVREISAVITLSTKLKDLLLHKKEAPLPEISETDLNLYLASAKHFAETAIHAVELVSRKDAPKRGIQAQIRQESVDIAKTLQPYPILRMQYSEIALLYREYLLTRQRPTMQKALNTLEELHTAIMQNNSFLDSKKDFITQHFDNVTPLYRELLDVDSAIAGIINDFTLQETATEPVSTKLIHQSQQETYLATQHIQLTRQIISILILTSTMVAIFAVLSLARLMHASVTHKVLTLAGAAKQYSEGNLTVRIHMDGDDELGYLGKNFNAMAARLNDMVVSLEGMVGKKTADLDTREAFYRQLFDHGSNAIAVYKAVNQGEDFVFLDFNRKGEEIEGLQKEDVIGKKVSTMFPALRKSGLLDVFREVWERGIPVSHPPFYYDDGRIEGWRQNRVYKLPTGEIVTMYDDLTQQKICEQEREIMEKRLRQAQKMEAIGLLAGGVAHDLNNILTAIVNYPELVLMQISKDSPLYSPVSQIRDSGIRAAAIVADLLTVARGVANKKDTTELNRLIESFFDSLEFRQIQTDHPNISYNKDLEKGLYNITCSTVHVIKCIMNLILNASEAISDTGVVTVHSRSEDIDECQTIKYGLKPGPYVVLGISDTGSGIAAADLDHIFEPFYTKKVMGQKSGTGLGLSIVWNTMLDHCGGVLVHSSSQGTHFDLYFPATSCQLSQTTKSTTLEKLQGNGETILIIDDEPELLVIASQILQELGYKTVSKESGEKAISYLQSHSVDLLLLDMIMDPGMNGRQTYEQILTIHPTQKALLASGFSDNTEVNKILALGASGYIGKPYTIFELGEAISTIFNRKKNGVTA